MSQIDELREILVGDNSERLSQLQQRVENIDARTKDVAEVLAPAINQGIAANNDLIDALKEPVSEGLKQAIRAEPIEYADILYPAIAPSIRLAISQAISSLLITINQTIESATSANGIKDRIESIRTGVPYAELVLRKSLLYRVEHVYLIDRDSGLLISECAASSTDALDSDAVSAMFSAIQSFVQDSFSGNIEDRLTDLKVGEHKVWIAHGANAMLACVIQGDAPESLKRQLYDCLDNISTSYAPEIAAFNGDNSEFVGVESNLEPLLQLQLKETENPVAGAMDKGPTIAQKLIMVGLCCLGLFLLINWFYNNSRLSTVEHYFASTPGLRLASVEWLDDKIVVDGMLDPDALLPLDILASHGINREDLLFQTTPFRSLEPKMEMQRFARELSPPNELSLVYTGQKVKLQGRAPIEWLIENDYRLRQLSADGRIDISELTAAELSTRHYLDKHFKSTSAVEKEAVVKAIVDRSWNIIDVTLIQPPK